MKTRGKLQLRVIRLKKKEKQIDFKNFSMLFAVALALVAALCVPIAPTSNIHLISSGLLLVGSS